MVDPQPTRRGFFGVAGAIAALLATKPFKVLDICIPGKMTVAPVVEQIAAASTASRTCTWLGLAGDCDWNNAKNWSTGLMPRDGDSVEVPMGSRIRTTPEGPVKLERLVAYRGADIGFLSPTAVRDLEAAPWEIAE